MSVTNIGERTEMKAAQEALAPLITEFTFTNSQSLPLKKHKSSRYEHQ